MDSGTRFFMPQFHARRIGKRMASMENLVQRNTRRTRFRVSGEGFAQIQVRWRAGKTFLQDGNRGKPEGQASLEHETPNGQRKDKEECAMKNEWTKLVRMAVLPVFAVAAAWMAGCSPTDGNEDRKDTQGVMRWLAPDAEKQWDTILKSPVENGKASSRNRGGTASTMRSY